MKIKIVIYFILFYFILLPFNVNAQKYKNRPEQELIGEAESLFKSGNYVSALPLYSQLLSLHPKDPLYSYRFGVCLLYGDRRDMSKPLKYLSDAVGKLKNENMLYYHLALAYHLNYRFPEAIKYYEKYAETAKSDKSVQELANYCIKLCRNGMSLLTDIKDLYVIMKKEVNIKDFYRSYDISNFGGSFLLKPDIFKTRLDKKRNDNSIVFLSNYNSTVYFSSYGKKGETGKDIYRSIKSPDGKWSKPERLSNVINTVYDEDYPYVLPDGKTLYFCSKGHNSMGGYDIFKSIWDTITNEWSTPKNLDFAINTPFDDILFVTDKKQQFAFFSSVRNSVENYITVYKVRIDIRPEIPEEEKKQYIAALNSNDSTYLQAAVILQEKSKLNVNSSIEEVTSAIVQNNINQNSTDKPYINLPADISIDKIIDTALTQYNILQTLTENIKKNTDLVYNYSEKKRNELSNVSQQIKTAEEKIIYNPDNILADKEKERINHLQNTVETIKQEINNCGFITTTLENKIIQQKKLSEQFFYDINKIKSYANKNQTDSAKSVLTKLLIQMQDIDTASSIDNIIEHTVTLQYNEKKNLISEYQKVIQENQSDIKLIDEEINYLKNEINNEKNPELKQYLQDKIKEAENDKNKREHLIEKYSNIRDKLTKETDKLLVDLQNIKTISEKIKSEKDLLTREKEITYHNDNLNISNAISNQPKNHISAQIQDNNELVYKQNEPNIINNNKNINEISESKIDNKEKNIAKTEQKIPETKNVEIKDIELKNINEKQNAVTDLSKINAELNNKINISPYKDSSKLEHIKQTEIKKYTDALKLIQSKNDSTIKNKIIFITDKVINLNNYSNNMLHKADTFNEYYYKALILAANKNKEAEALKEISETITKKVKNNNNRLSAEDSVTLEITEKKYVDALREASLLLQVAENIKQNADKLRQSASEISEYALLVNKGINVTDSANIKLLTDTVIEQTKTLLYTESIASQIINNSKILLAKIEENKNKTVQTLNNIENTITADKTKTDDIRKKIDKTFNKKKKQKLIKETELIEQDIEAKKSIHQKLKDSVLKMENQIVFLNMQIDSMPEIIKKIEKLNTENVNIANISQNIISAENTSKLYNDKLFAENFKPISENIINKENLYNEPSVIFENEQNKNYKIPVAEIKNTEKNINIPAQSKKLETKNDTAKHIEKKIYISAKNVENEYIEDKPDSEIILIKSKNEKIKQISTRLKMQVNILASLYNTAENKFEKDSLKIVINNLNKNIDSLDKEYKTLTELTKTENKDTGIIKIEKLYDEGREEKFISETKRKRKYADSIMTQLASKKDSEKYRLMKQADSLYKESRKALTIASEFKQAENLNNYETEKLKTYTLLYKNKNDSAVVKEISRYINETENLNRQAKYFRDSIKKEGVSLYNIEKLLAKADSLEKQSILKQQMLVNIICKKLDIAFDDVKLLAEAETIENNNEIIKNSGADNMSSKVKTKIESIEKKKRKVL